MTRGWPIGALLLAALCLSAGPGMARDPLWELLPWNERLGVDWYEHRGVRGDAEAQALAGAMHERGIGTPVDRAQALHWYRMAAENGQPAAQFRLGVLLGQISPPDHAAAAQWFRAAAEGGIAPAAYNLAVLHETGQGVAADETEAARLYEQAFRDGLPQAALNRALLALRASPPDAASAYLWLLRAQDAGVAAAEGLVAEVAPLLSDEQRQAAEIAARESQAR
ncbi:MAG: tetratricopeptide repeat protein [Tistlia sp.]|uniref:tetratricopeptide repeat protein n=1 Tax=Tistlia sp. TaxID=3057121 RepID=UPI0034A2A861